MNIRLLFLFFFLIIINNIYTQEQDFQLWIGLEATAPIKNGFNISLENEKRFYENASIYGRNQTDLGLGYDINRTFAISASYRMNYYYPFTELVYLKSRWVSSFYYKPRYKRWRFNVRLRVSNDSETYVPGWFEQRVLHRERFRALYNFRNSPFRVHASAETYFPISYNPFELRKIRIITGVQIRAIDNHRFGIDYVYDREFNRNNALTAYIIQFSYRYSLDDF